MIDLLILGTQYHTNVVSANIDFVTNKKRIEITSYTSMLKSFFYMLFSKKIYFVYVPIENKKYINPFIITASLLRKELYFSWIGTDVLNLIKNKNKLFVLLLRLFNKNKITHLFECTWLQDEAKTKGIHGSVGPYITFSSLFKNSFNPDSHFRNSDKLIVLSYATKGREQFYGINILKDVAKQMPDIEFRIVGVHGKDTNNFKHLGWINKEKLSQQYAEAGCFIRIPEHDGLSYSVLEAMYNGMYIIFNYDYRHCNKSSHDINDLISTIAKVEKQYSACKFNHDAHEYIKNEFVIHNPSRINSKAVITKS
ncbi:glycosyl hydrolase family 1 [Escherichia coli]